MSLNPNTRVCRNTTLPFQDFDDFAVILSPKTNEIHELNGLGKYIWEQMSEAHTVESLVNSVVQDFDVGLDIAEKDVQDFLIRLEGLNLLEQSVE